MKKVQTPSNSDLKSSNPEKDKQKIKIRIKQKLVGGLLKKKISPSRGEIKFTGYRTREVIVKISSVPKTFRT
jgi:hypothetical protein